MFDNQCMYCARNENLTNLMLPICCIDGFNLYLLKNQAYLGRCVLAYHDHVGTVAEMDPQVEMRFFAAAQKVARALTNVFSPGQINMGMYADKVRHAHIHIVPKYEGGLDWGGIFQMNPQPEKLLSTQEYEQLIQKIREEIARLDTLR